MENCSNHKKEVWKDVIGFNGDYAVGSYGNVISHKNSRGKDLIALKPTISNGYKRVCLCKKGIKYYKFIHFLIAQTFIENPNNYPVINHKDGNKLNNNIENLEWCTPAYNIRHAVKTGLISTQNGEYSRKSKLTKEQATEIYNSPDTINALAKRFKVSNSTINAIRKGVNWKHLRNLDCSGHPRQILGIGDMKHLADLIGDLHYETLAELIDELSKKISLDGLKDEANGKVNLANNLFMVAGYLAKAHVYATWASKINKPFMDKTKQP